MVHGYGDSEHLIHLAEFMAKMNIYVILFDLNGFGYSYGNRFNPKQEDLNQSFMRFFYLMNKKKPVFVLAEGYGATFFINFLLKSKINISGLILASPWIEMPKQFEKGNRLKSLVIK